MAIRDISKKPYLQDEVDEVHIGIDLPFRKGDGPEGWFATTKTTSEAIRNDLLNFLNTRQGERLFQPTLGLGLEKYLFENVQDSVLDEVEENIRNSISYWFPFVVVRDVDVIMDEDNQSARGIMRVTITFSVTKDPGNLEVVQVEFGE